MTQILDYTPGHTYHGRKGDINNAFRYSVDYVLLDAEAALKTPWLFSRSTKGIFSIRDIDHGGAPREGCGAAWVREVLSVHCPDFVPSSILLWTQARTLGYLFNPVSFWFCLDDEGSLRAIISEVSNTFGDRHCYLCHLKDMAVITPKDEMTATKIFHVSPFQPVEGTYTFRFELTPTRVAAWIDYTHGKGGLIATLTGQRHELRTRHILMSLIRKPFGPLRVMTLIHWQALKLAIKGASYRRRPEPPSEAVSRSEVTK